MAEPTPRLGYAAFPSPVGTLHLVFAGETLVHLDFADNSARMERMLTRRYGDWAPAPAPLPEAIAAPLEAYFAGELEAPRRLARLAGGSAFQRTVWRALDAIPSGRTVRYADLAASCGRDARASRAIGNAVGANPLAVVVPCHRVVGANGRLTGYAGGLERKRWLLRHEGVAV
jgi:methylated-DNA-[protein]-cysteine S-methyltransferase